jgi:hypothetical protein
MFPAYLKNPLGPSHHISLCNLSGALWNFPNIFRPSIVWFTRLSQHKSDVEHRRVMTKTFCVPLREMIVLWFAGPSIRHREDSEDFYDFRSDNESEDGNLWSGGKSLNAVEGRGNTRYAMAHVEENWKFPEKNPCDLIWTGWLTYFLSFSGRITIRRPTIYQNFYELSSP